MPSTEIVIWSAMAGVLMALVTVLLIDTVLRQRSLRRLRVWLLLTMMSVACLVMSGLPQLLWPALADGALMVVKVALGPLTAAVALAYLGQWSGVRADDRLVRVLMGPGAGCVALSGAALLVWYLAGGDGQQVLAWSALVNGLAVLMGALVATRSAILGDRLARWMVVACLCLAQMTAGLYGKGLGLDMSLRYWLLTAVAAASYFILVMTLINMRYRELARLRRQASGEMPRIDQAGLPRGAALVGKVDDALWRSARMGRPCVISAIVVTNLYAHGEAAAQDAETEIVLTLAARLRQDVGFRNVVGLLHQGCFVLAVSAVQDPHHHRVVGRRLIKNLRMAVTVSQDPLALPFQPDVAIGVVHVPAGAADADALRIVNLAEQLALEASHLPVRSRQAVWQNQAPSQPLPFVAAAATAPAPLDG